MDLFKLVGSIFVDTDSANESLSKTDKKASSVGDTLSKVGSTAAKFGTAVVAGATAAVSGLISLESQTASTADEIDKASIRMGISAEDYQKYAYAAELAGVDTSTLEKAAKKLEGTDIDFNDAMESIMSLGTAEERSAKASELFGDTVAYNLSPLIEQSGEDFAAATQEAEDLGLVMSNDEVKAGAAMNDSFTKISESLSMLKTNLGSALAPVVQKFADYILDHMPEIQSLFDKLAPIVTSFMERLLPILLDMADTLLPVIFDVLDQLLPVFSEIAEQVLPIFTEIIEALSPFIAEFCQLLLPVILDLLKTMLPVIKDVLTLLSPILELILKLLEPIIKLIDEILPPVIEWIGKVVSVVVDTLKPVIEDVSTFVSNLGTTVTETFENMKTGIKNAVNSVLGFINSLISGVTGGINSVIRAINSVHIDIPEWLQGLTGMTTIGFSIPELTAPQIPLLAKGGTIEGGAAIVGEDGPELIQSTGKQTKVTPLNDNNNDFVEVSDKLDRLIAIFENGFGVTIDGKTLVGALANDINNSLGTITTRQGRAFA